MNCRIKADGKRITVGPMTSRLMSMYDFRLLFVYWFWFLYSGDVVVIRQLLLFYSFLHL